MSKSTKIVLFHSKELIYTGIFIIFGIILTLLLVLMFSKPNKSENNETTYKSGVYSSQILLGDSELSVNVIVEDNSISEISIENMNETINTMYPLLEPTVSEINSQINQVDNIEDINYSSNNQYTYILIYEAIEKALENAKE